MTTNGISRLSRLDERFGIAQGLAYVSASNAVVRLVDDEGRARDYVDFMSAYGSVNFGHNNECIRAAVARNADTVGRFYPVEAEQVAVWLCQRLGREEGGRVLFQVGGSHAVGAAIALAQRERPGIVLAVQGSFHGLGVESLAASSIQHTSALQSTALLRGLDPFVRLLVPGAVPETWDGVSCLIYEPVQGANGYIPLDPDWLGELERQAASARVVTIADEVQAGFYRHGSLSPARAMGLSPDIQLFSKSLTNGTFPLAAVVYDARLEPRCRQAFLAHTFQTSAMGYYWAKAVADYIDTAPLRDMVDAVNAALVRFGALLDGSGAATDIHVTGPSLSFRPLSISAREVVVRAQTLGVLVFAGGAAFERIRVAPPLTVLSDQLEAGLKALAHVLCGTAHRNAR
jgi:4-aminobutyrate aminotransferase-like enzyme